jgi:hypothetical protein
MDCHIDWSTSKVEHGKLRVRLEPPPNFAFMMEFDGIVDPLKHHRHEGWGAVLLAHGHVVVSDVRLESAQELRTSLMTRCERRIDSPWTLARAGNSRRKPKRLARPSRKLSGRPPRRSRLSATRS